MLPIATFTDVKSGYAPKTTGLPKIAAGSNNAHNVLQIYTNDMKIHTFYDFSDSQSFNKIFNILFSIFKNRVKAQPQGVQHIAAPPPQLPVQQQQQLQPAQLPPSAFPNGVGQPMYYPYPPQFFAYPHGQPIPQPFHGQPFAAPALPQQPDASAQQQQPQPLPPQYYALPGQQQQPPFLMAPYPLVHDPSTQQQQQMYALPPAHQPPPPQYQHMLPQDAAQSRSNVNQHPDDLL